MTEPRRNGRTSPWSPARDRLLRHCWMEGRTAADIARVFSDSDAPVSRSAVLSRARALDLPRRKGAQVRLGEA